ncbi:hypothetical protein RB5475 [Rhodopirellula baltica SH 1]|uniref:Uncharacterized protein n=1 Tax=Rhodopirellula baltica (strain DSM 10527 / NCIMB 13988 / SH1) TaxID=243090 RepID=Q7URS6_RHOBA|nr:hypothetical protein RB5475 [Rhodopirellula baltica SH 1]
MQFERDDSLAGCDGDCFWDSLLNAKLSSMWNYSGDENLLRFHYETNSMGIAAWVLVVTSMSPHIVETLVECDIQQQYCSQCGGISSIEAFYEPIINLMSGAM